MVKPIFGAANIGRALPECGRKQWNGRGRFSCRHSQTLSLADQYQRVFQHGTRIARYLFQIVMQDRIRRTAVLALGAIGLEIAQTHQQFAQVVWTLALQLH